MNEDGKNEYGEAGKYDICTSAVQIKKAMLLNGIVMVFLMTKRWLLDLE